MIKSIFVSFLFPDLLYSASYKTTRRSVVKKERTILLVLLSIILLASPVLAAGQSEVSNESEKMTLRFFFPIGTAGNLANIMTNLCNEYSEQNPEVSIEAIYAGDYVQTFQRTLTSSRAGNPPDVAVLTNADVWTAVDEGIATPLQTFIDSEGEGFLDRFFPAMLDDCMVAGEYYAIPFQKSTHVLYYNKDMFREAGLDPEKGPETWEELVEYCQALTIPGERYGVEVPIDFYYMAVFILQNGGTINNTEGSETYLDTPAAIEAMQYLKSLVDAGYMPAKRLYGDSSSDFVAGKTAMMYNSSGSLAFVRDSCSFDWGVCYLPAGKERIAPTGGGQFVICQGISEERQKAAWDFIKWMTEPEQAAEWSIGSGFIAVNPKSFDLPVMVEYNNNLPQALVARDQMEYAMGEYPKTHNCRQIAQIMSTTFESIMAGISEPQAAMEELQKSCDSILNKYR